MSGKQITLVAVLVVIAVAYLLVYVDWTRDELMITYELRPPRRAQPGAVYTVAFGFPTAMQFEEIEVTVAPEGATPKYGGVATTSEPVDPDDGNAGDEPEADDLAMSEQAMQAGLVMDRMERSDEVIERMRRRAEERNRPEPTFERSYLVYGRGVAGMARENRPIRLKEGTVYRLSVRTVDGLAGQIDFATREVPEG
ncbi:MAG: hypothetical protein AAF586_01065 [Planctomycetota bacterium]